MGWFEEQIKLRKQNDQDVFEESIFRMASAVLGQKGAGKLNDFRLETKEAVDEILKYYRFKPTEVPEVIKDAEEQMNYALRPHGIMRREVDLNEGWQKDAFGPMIVYWKENGIPQAVFPKLLSGYYYKDEDRTVTITSKVAEQFERRALCFYRPLPQKSIGIPDLTAWLWSCISASDVVMFVGLTLAVVIVGMIIPQISKLLTGMVLESGNMTFLWGTALFIFSVAVTSQLFQTARELMMDRLVTKTDLAVESAVMMRVMGLPTTFFRKYTSGELQTRFESVSTLSSLIVSGVFATCITSVASLLYITQIVNFTPSLALPALLIIFATTLLSLYVSIRQVKVSKRQMELSAKENGISYALISGVQKIKLAGAEKRAFSKWATAYAETAGVRYNPPMILKISSAAMQAILLAGSIAIYYIAVKNNVTTSEYIAFSLSYGQVTAAFSALSGIAISVAQIKPILEMAEPILQETPEMSDGKEILTSLNGGIELNNVYFRYQDNMPYVVDGLSLKIKAGEYIALVGKTGCGKSTLVRLLLGFEKPERGAIYYDGKDITGIDLQSLRRKIGTVTQDGQLFQGDIYSNITVSAPELTFDEAWEAAEIAGIADDIRDMPMQMQTVIAEGQGGISGGQKQRLMIARAIAPKPKILIFDEATSALDNKTQKQVSEALDSLKCTRIVIAHRLSTIKNCDRILLLEGGKIKESGTFDELIALNGSFAELVSRQRI